MAATGAGNVNITAATAFRTNAVGDDVTSGSGNITITADTIEMTGDGKGLDAFINALDNKIILEVVRSGVTGIARGGKAM